MKTSMRSGLSVAPLARTLSAALVLSAPIWTPSANAVTAEAAAPSNPPPIVIQGSQAPSKLSPGVQEITKMVDAKVDPGVIKTYIKSSPTPYFLSAQEIIDLKGKGVPDDVLTAMMQHGAELRTRAAQAMLPPNPNMPSPDNVAPQYAPDAYSQAPGYAQAVSPADYSDYGAPYAYDGYPYYYYPYYPYSYYSYWWGYPWYGYYYWPYYYYHNHGHDGHHDHDGNHDHGHVDHHGNWSHSSSVAGNHGSGATHGNQPWQPVGTTPSARGSSPWQPYGTTASARGAQAWQPVGTTQRPSSFSGGRAFSPVGNAVRPASGFAARPMGSFAARPTSFASAGFHGGSPGFRGGMGGFHGGGGGGGHAMGGGGHR